MGEKLSLLDANSVSLMSTLVYVLTAIATIITIFEFFLKPEVKLKIRGVQFIKRSFNGVEGYQLKADVTNKGKKICFNLRTNV